MCKLGFRWWDEPENRGQIEADANNMRARYGFPAFGSLSQLVLVQETNYWTDEYSLIEDKPEGSFIPPSGDYFYNQESNKSKTVGSHYGNQIFTYVPANYSYIGRRYGETESDWDISGVITWYIHGRQNIYYDYGPS